jgi:hypothetical protein
MFEDDPVCELPSPPEIIVTNVLNRLGDFVDLVGCEELENDRGGDSPLFLNSRLPTPNPSAKTPSIPDVMGVKEDISDLSWVIKKRGMVGSHRIKSVIAFDKLILFFCSYCVLVNASSVQL